VKIQLLLREGLVLTSAANSQINAKLQTVVYRFKTLGSLLTQVSEHEVPLQFPRSPKTSSATNSDQFCVKLCREGATSRLFSKCERYCDMMAGPESWNLNRHPLLGNIQQTCLRRSRGQLTSPWIPVDCSQFDSEVEAGDYLHLSTASSKRRRNGNPVPGGITGPTCSLGIKIRGPGPPGWESLTWE
jgi:hypothetical protein